MTMFNTARNSGRNRNLPGEPPCLRILHAAGELPPECLFPGDFEGDDPIGKLPKDENKAKLAIEEKIWRKFGYNRLPEGVAEAMLEIALDLGVAQAHRLLQRAVLTLNTPVEVTGVMDAKTIQAATRCVGRFTNPAVVGVLRAHQQGFIRQIVIGAPKLREHLDAWLEGARV